MDDKILDWVVLAEKFSADGDPLSMRTAAREIFELDKNSADGLSIMAEASLYQGDLDAAQSFAGFALSVKTNHLRGRLVTGGVAMKRLRLKDQLKIFDDLIGDARNQLKTLTDRREIFIARAILFKALSWSSNGLYLAGDPLKAAANLSEASTLTDNLEQAAELYSKHLFLRNYRDVSPAQTPELAKNYNTFFAKVAPFPHKAKPRGDKIHIGYISPDFRTHALTNFIVPLIRDFDAENFSVTCYMTGRKDSVTERLKSFNVTWRTLTGKDSLTAAQIIDNDGVDILVDLSGHSQDSCLPILAHKPSAIQISALGYTATTGLNAVDYFLSDKICSPAAGAFTEKILRLDTCCFCYAPGLIRDMPDTSTAPVLKNNFVTFASFNNFAKVSDDVLYVWRAILDGVPRSRLILKGKIFSLDDGKALVRERFKRLSFPINRVEFRAYTPDYLEQYRDVDIALDTFPYTGGTTTCEALYMGVPVITLRGKTHGSRISASILTAADVAELVAATPMDYVKKAIQLSRRKDLIAAYHERLRGHLKASALMDGQLYMHELEKFYRELSLSITKEH